MLKFIPIKRFADKKKLEEAKKRAMEMYNKIITEENASKNKKLEEEILSDIDSRKQPDVSDFKTPEAKDKVGYIADNFKFVDTQKKKDSKNLNLNYFNRINDSVLHFKLDDKMKSTIDKDDWVKMYEAKFDPNYEKFLKYLFQFLKILIFYKTLWYFKKYVWGRNNNNKKNRKNNDNNQNNKNTNEAPLPISLKNAAFIILFYSTTFGLYFSNKGYTKKLIYKILVKGDKVRIFKYNQNKTRQNTEYIETEIANLIKMTSKSRNLHQIFYRSIEKKKVLQLFALKNGLYDERFLFNLCHPKVKAVEFTNVNRH